MKLNGGCQIHTQTKKNGKRQQNGDQQSTGVRNYSSNNMYDKLMQHQQGKQQTDDIEKGFKQKCSSLLHKFKHSNTQSLNAKPIKIKHSNTQSLKAKPIKITFHLPSVQKNCMGQQTTLSLYASLFLKLNYKKDSDVCPPPPILPKYLYEKFGIKTSQKPWDGH